MGRAGENGLVASKGFQKKGRKTIFVFIWPGAGIVLIALIGFFVFKQHLDLAAIIGLALIIAGVVVINVFPTRHPIGEPVRGSSTNGFCWDSTCNFYLIIGACNANIEKRLLSLRTNL